LFYAILLNSLHEDKYQRIVERLEVSSKITFVECKKQLSDFEYNLTLKAEEATPSQQQAIK